MPGKGQSFCWTQTLGGQTPCSSSLFVLPSQWLQGLNSQYLSFFMCFPGDKESTEEADFPNLNSQSLKVEKEAGTMMGDSLKGRAVRRRPQRGSGEGSSTLGAKWPQGPRQMLGPLHNGPRQIDSS